MNQQISQTDSDHTKKEQNRLKNRAEDLAERLYYTYKTHYTMAEYYEKEYLFPIH